MSGPLATPGISLRCGRSRRRRKNKLSNREGGFQMDIGFLMAPTAQSGDLAGAARLIESLGYESLWIPEHPVIPVNMKTPLPFTHDNRLPDHYARCADPFIGLTVAAT